MSIAKVTGSTTKLFMVIILHRTFIGEPAAWTITDAENANSYTEFFRAIKARVPDAIINTLMTGDGNFIVFIHISPMWQGQC